MAKNKVFLTKKESENVLPIIREFNRFSKSFIQVLTKRTQIKEKKISIMVSRISVPGQRSSHVRVKSVDFTRSFLSKQKKKRKKESQSNQSQSEWDDGFSEKRGFVI